MILAAQAIADLSEANHDLLYVGLTGSVLTFLGVAVVAWTSLATAKRSKSIHSTLGVPNGQGTVAVMLEHAIGSIDRLDTQFKAHVVENSESFDELRVVAASVKTALEVEATKVRIMLEERDHLHEQSA